MSTPLGERLREPLSMIPMRVHGSLVVSTLPDGARLVLRPAVPGDNERLRRMFYRLTPTTVYRRLFLPVPQAPHWADHFVALGAMDQARRAMVALIADEVVGIANYARTTTRDTAELAIVVEDAWQGRGVGRRLLARLAKEAADRRIGIFTARILGDNFRALRFVKRFFPGARIRWDDGEYTVRIRLA